MHASGCFEYDESIRPNPALNRTDWYASSCLSASARPAGQLDMLGRMRRHAIASLVLPFVVSMVPHRDLTRDSHHLIARGNET